MTDLELIAVHHVSLTVRDLEVSAAWYRDVLGFVELFREEAEHRRACVMRFADGSYSLGLVEHVPSDRDGFDATVTGLDHLAFTVASEEALAAWADRLTAAGVEHSGAIPIPPGAILNFTDPAGIAWALCWDQPTGASTAG